MADVDFNYFLARKYAILQQQADADTSRAGSANISAVAGANAANAAANVDNTRAGLMPAESKSAIALQGAQTALTRQQADWFGPEAQSRIGLNQANIGYIGTQDAVLRKEGLDTRYSTPMGGALTGVMGAGYQPFRFSATDPLPRRKAGETEAAYMNRINGL